MALHKAVDFVVLVAGPDGTREAFTGNEDVEEKVRGSLKARYPKTYQEFLIHPPVEVTKAF